MAGAILFGTLSNVWAGTPQTIIFPAIPTKLTTDSPFTLGASASSGLTVSYTVVSPAGIASVAGSTVTLSEEAGSVTVKASQAGNGTFDPAPDVYASFQVISAGERYVKIAPSGSLHHLAIKADGTLWTWGSNDNYELGDGTANDLSAPTKIGVATNWASAAAGIDHSLAIRTNGTLWSWGQGLQGQTGGGNTNWRTTPEQVGTATNWLIVAAGSYNSLGIKSDGTLWAWGNNASGQLGDGTSTTRLSPVQIGTATNWSKVAAGEDFSIGLRSDGSLWAWGLNSSGQLGDGSTIQRTSPVRIGTDNDWSVIDCGSRHTLAIKTNGALYAWGNNSDRQLGDGTTTNRLAPIRIGTETTWSNVNASVSHSAALKFDGSLWTWGSNSDGSLGGPTVSYFSAVPMRIDTASTWSLIGGAGAVALRSDGSLWTWGKSDYSGSRLGRIPDRPSPLSSFSSGVRQASAGYQNTFVIRSDNTLWTAGYNEWFMLGDGTLSNHYTPVQLGTDSDWLLVRGSYTFTLALKTNGTLWSWGLSTDGQLGNGIGGYHSTPQQAGSATNWAALATGQYHALGLQADGTLWAWGSNSYGQVGNNSHSSQGTPVQIGNGTNWSKIACGGAHSLGIQANGTLWSWGRNENGQLGDGTTLERTSPVQVGSATDWSEVAAGEYHTVALKTNGALWVWGNNAGGQLGNPAIIGDQTTPVQLGTATDWTSIACNGGNVIALKVDGSAWIWGANSVGQISNGTTVDQPTPVRIGGSKVWRALGASSPQSTHTLLIALDGSLWGAGPNMYGALEDGGLRYWSPGLVHPTPVEQAISFSSMPVLVTGMPASLSATASSGLPVRFGVSGPATLSGSEVTRTGLGVIEVMALQAGDGVWKVAQPAVLTTGPQLVVEQPSGTPLMSSISTINAGNLLIGQSSAAFTVTLRSAGGETLSGLSVTKDGTHAAEFSISSLGAASLAPGTSTTFTVTFTPTGMGDRTATLHIASNDANDNPFDIALTGFGQTAEIAVADFSGNNLNDGTATIGFGTVVVTGGQPRNFTISNQGNINLTGVSVAIDGTHANQFVLLTPPASTVVPSGTTLFTVRFVPTSAGAKTAALHITSNDANENPFDISLNGTGSLSTNANLISLVPDTGSLSPAFNSNTTSYTLTVPTNVTSITFTPTTQASAATVQINAVPVTSGAASGPINLSMGSNLITTQVTAQDGTTTKTYTVTVTRQAPEITVEQPAGNPLTDGSGIIDFGGLLPGTPVTRNFKIKNDGAGTLSSIVVTIDGAAGGDFVLTISPAASLLAGENTTFSVRFTPSIVGVRAGGLHIANNDPDESPFDIILTGEGLTASQNWQQQFFGTTNGSGDAAPTADPNKNGIPNILEYALGGDPVGNNTGTAVLPDLGINPTVHCAEFSLTRYTDRNDITLTVQAADSLAGPWANLARSVNGAAFTVVTAGCVVSETGSGSTRSVTLCDIYQTTDALHPRRFLRLEVEQ